MSVKPRPFHPAPWDHFARLSPLLGASASQSGPLLPMRSTARFPPGPRGPLGASVTLWEATAPVKLPTRHCPETRSGSLLELRLNQAGIPRLTPPELAPELHSLPAILYRLSPNSMPSCSKAPRGLSVLPRVTCIFTGIAVSPSLCPRQRSTRYAIRAGRNLPDKEFR